MNAPLKLSFADWCFSKPGTEADFYYSSIRKLGYIAAEMVDPANRDTARHAGLSLLNMAAVRGKMNRAEHREAAIAQIRKGIAEAGEAGIPQLIVFSGNREGQDPRIGQMNCAAVLKAVVPDAERAGVTLTLEVFNTYDHPDYDADSGGYAFEVCREVGSPAVKVLYDIYHMHRMNADVISDVTQNLDLIAHLHVAGTPNREFPGTESSLDYGEVVRAIHAAGYRGWWGMEFKVRGDAVEELKRAAELFNGFVG